MPRRALAALTASALGLGLAVAVLNAPAASAAPPAQLPPVYPTPQSMQAAGAPLTLRDSVALVTDRTSDAAAVSATRQLLSGDGVGRVDAVADPSAAQPGEPVIFVGGAGADAAARALGVSDASGLPAEGYVLVDGLVRGRPTIVLDGHDGSGTFYAVQTLRQLISRHGSTLSVPGVRVRDWPGLPVRGVIEGFYGTPWSDAQRLVQMDFYGAHKMNTYVYSPKNDPYLRDQWRDPYPPAQLAVLKTLVARATANHVQFTYALSPGLSICYSSATDEQTLVAKFQSLWDIGVRSFSIPLDDISYTNWNCAADQTKFGTGGGAAGAAQAYLLNEVQRDFIATHPGVQPLQMVPTEYSNVSDSPYKTAIRTQLDPAVVVGWTGVGVVPATITAAQAQAARTVFGHRILLWDNYPVNDYTTDRLLLGPYNGRDPAMAGQLYGITANPMIEPEASKLALFGVADYTWNAPAYDAAASWQAALTELSGGDAQARQALAAFADLEYYSVVNPEQAPVLAAKIAAFWSAWEQGDSGAASPLDAYLQVIQQIPTTLAARMNDPEFVSETQPWLDSASAWGSAARAALHMLQAERSGDGAAALADRQEAEAQEAKARSYTYAGLNGTVHVTVGDGVVDTFVNTALAEDERWFGVAGRHATAITSLPTYQSYVPANMVDGDDSTYFWSSRSPNTGDYVGVDLGATEPITSVRITGGDAASPNDYLHVATLEYSVDGTTWTTAGNYANQSTITATLPAGTFARYVRLRATAGDSYWVKIHEFDVTGPNPTALQVTGTPPAATGSSLAAAADGNLDTSYVAARKPATGDALVVTLPAPRAVRTVSILGTGQAVVDARVGDTWQRLGALSSSGFTELAAEGATVSALRLYWTPSSPAPTITEIVPWYADTAEAGLTLTPRSPETTVGTPVTVTAQLTSTQPRDDNGTLTVGAPAGVTVTPQQQQVSLPRGSQQTFAFAVTADHAGSYPVTVTFAVPGRSPVSAKVTVTVHPQVSSTNVALASQGGTATASSVEDGLPQFTPDHAIDGDLTTRWSSDHSDDQWLQVHFAQPQHLGKVVLRWETAHATTYELQTSSDGTTWTTAATVTNSPGGTETEWIDAANVNYLRMQGVTRATVYGYSLYELEAYPIS